MKAYEADENKASADKTLKLAKIALIIFFLLAVPVMGGLLMYDGIGVIAGMMVGWIFLLIYLGYTGKL